MKTLEVYYNGWGERWLLGTLADDGKNLLFEYSSEALKQELELSPRHLKLASVAYGDFPDYLQRLPGLISDALPDGWGMLIMDRLFRKQNINPATLSPLDRLAFIGTHALGALTFEPSKSPEIEKSDLNLLDLAKEVKRVISGKDSTTLRQLAAIGGSPHGARPKVLVYYNNEQSLISTAPFPGGQPWIVKFQAAGEHKEVCALEDLYAQLARNCGLDMPDTRYFDLNKNLSAFGAARFDIEGGLRVPVHTLAGALHADFRIPSSIDYTTLLRATLAFTKSEKEVKKAYACAVFNVLFHNRDDHGKNFSFRLNKNREWKFSPSYDLTYSNGPGGEHQIDVCGHGSAITRSIMLELASSANLDLTWAATTIDQFLAQAENFKQLAAGWTIRPKTIKSIGTVIEENLNLLRA